MKKSLLLKGLIAILVVLTIGLAAVGCSPAKKEEPNDNANENIDNTPTEEVVVSKDALNAEIALAITAQGDYTADSYNAYAKKLADAKAVANNESATQEAVDNATSALTAARLALAIRPIQAVDGAHKAFRIMSGNSKEIAIADYVNVNGLSKITYTVKSSDAVLEVSPIVDGKFTITAGEVKGETDVTVSIVVSYDGKVKYETDIVVTITNDSAPVLFGAEISKEYDIFDLTSKTELVIDLAENVDNAGNIALSYSVNLNGYIVGLEGAGYTYSLGEYGDEYSYVSFDVTVSYVANGVEGILSYTYKLGLKDTSAYRVVNGGFENGLDGWTASGESFGSIKDNSTFWDQNFPMYNVGKYFSSEGAEGTLASPYFVANSKYATFMIGSAAKHNVYVAIEDENGNVLAIYRNTMFADLPADVTDWNEQHQLIGVSVFVCNFVTYKVDISAFQGQSIRFVVHDHEEDGGFGFAFFDELNTYYASEDSVPESAILAENLLANKDALKAEIALEVTAQGDYTADSYNAYVAKLAEVKALVDDVAITQAMVDEATAALTAARLGLTVRPIAEVEGANKSFRLTSGNVKEIALADYININGLSSVTYAIEGSELVSLSDIVDGKFTVTAKEVGEAANAAVSIIVSYKGEVKLTVIISVQITNDVAPTLFSKEIFKEYDIYSLENKTSIVINLADNVDNAGNLPLSYTVNGVASEANYTFTFGKYTDDKTVEALTVVVSYVANGEEQSISYTYKLGMNDTTEYRLVNGGFENGLEGWTVVGNIGNASSNGEYWKGPFGMDGEKMFSAYDPVDLEKYVGTLTSSSFKVGGSGFVTFKIGAMRDENYVYIDVVDAETKQILARYYNGLWEGTDCTLVAYKADLSAFMGKEVFFRISDNADSGYGLFFADSFVTYYDMIPDGFNDATPVSYSVSGTIYDLFNGGFEMGNVQGWWSIGEIGVVTNANGYWGDNIPYEKVGDYLFTGVESFGADTMREGNRGSLTSSVFEIGGSGWISFKLGGGGNALCYVQVIDAVTGEILARYHQEAQQDAKLIQYVADLSAYIGRTARIQVVDQADGGWGCVSFDHVVTYYASKPEGLEAKDIKGNLKYNIENGSFETGNIDGWTMNITEAGAHNTLGWVLDKEIDAGWYAKNDDTKDGNFLLTFATPADINCENTKGYLQSSTFSLKQGAFVSFKFGGAGGAQNHDVYIELCRADGSVIARFYNDAPGKVNTRMNAYFYQYNDVEVECFFRVVDNSTGDYGCFVIDDFRVNLESAPEGYIAAIQ